MKGGHKFSLFNEALFRLDSSILLFALLPFVLFILHCVVLKGCEREVAAASDGDSDERKNESIMRLSWALVHSRQKEDIQRGVAMLESKVTYRIIFSALD